MWARGGVLLGSPASKSVGCPKDGAQAGENATSPVHAECTSGARLRGQGVEILQQAVLLVCAYPAIKRARKHTIQKRKAFIKWELEFRGKKRIPSRARIGRVKYCPVFLWLFGSLSPVSPLPQGCAPPHGWLRFRRCSSPLKAAGIFSSCREVKPPSRPILKLVSFTSQRDGWPGASWSGFGMTTSPLRANLCVSVRLADSRPPSKLVSFAYQRDGWPGTSWSGFGMPTLQGSSD